MYKYNTLWKIMNDKGLERRDIIRLANVSNTTLTRMKQGKPISYDVCRRICEVVGCTPGEIAEYVEDGGDT